MAADMLKCPFCSNPSEPDRRPAELWPRPLRIGAPIASNCVRVCGSEKLRRTAPAALVPQMRVEQVAIMARPGKIGMQSERE